MLVNSKHATVFDLGSLKALPLAAAVPPRHEQHAGAHMSV
jgi:hypothetical protein